MDTPALRRFQAEHVDWTGRPLKVDGQLGPKTRWALAISDLPRHRRDIVQIACSQVGVEETPIGSNRGVAVDGYLKPAGVGLGQPWCAAFVCWVLRAAGCLESLRYVASAAACLRQLRPACSPPLPGDVFGWVNPDGTGHVGFVIGDDGTPAGGIVTCEGNSRHGVRVNTRPLEGLSFGVVPQPLVLVSAVVPGAPVVFRSYEGTR